MKLPDMCVTGTVVVVVAVSSVIGRAAEPAPAGRGNYDRPFEPPTRSALIQLPPGAVEPQGWLRDWSVKIRDNYTARMDDVDVAFKQAWAADYKLPASKINSWSEGAWPFEGGGYWFDGLAGLGAALHDEAMQKQAHARFHAVADNMHADSLIFMWWLSRQTPEHMDAIQGIGVNEPEWAAWANGLFGRAMATYYHASGDKAALKALELAYSGDPKWVRLGWSMSNAWPAFQTYTWTGNPAIKAALTEMFAKGGINEKEFSWNRYRTPPGAETGPADHGVHFCESTTPWALGYLWTGKREFLDAALGWHDRIARDCMQPHGVPVFDEYWGPTGAFRGSETCDVGAYLWSQSMLLAISGQGRLADRMERAFFNAVPAVMARDGQAHVYMQSPNRMADKALPAAPPFTYSFKHYPLCCTAVANRLLPTYITNMWMATRDGGLAATCYGPCKVSGLVAERVPVELTCKTDYPFNETIEIAVKPEKDAKFPLLLHVPGWCRRPIVKVNDTVVKEAADEEGFVRVERTWKVGDKVVLEFPMSPDVSRWGRDANAGGAPYATVSYGPLLLALAIPDTQDANTPDPAAKWQYALQAHPDDPGLGMAVERGPMPARWDWPLDCPLKLRVKAVSIDWKPTLEKPLPAAAVEGSNSPEQIRLVPYGCTKLRVSMFPVTRGTIAPMPATPAK